MTSGKLLSDERPAIGFCSSQLGLRDARNRECIRGKRGGRLEGGGEVERQGEGFDGRTGEGFDGRTGEGGSNRQVEEGAPVGEGDWWEGSTGWGKTLWLRVDR